MNQYLFGEGGKMIILAHFYIYISAVNMETKHKYDLFCSQPLFILTSCYSLYMFGGFQKCEVIYCFISLIYTLFLMETLMRRMMTLTESLLEKEKEKTSLNVKQKMIAVVSHELRNPLQALSFLISYLDSFHFEKIKKDIINDIKSTTELLNSIIENVLDFSKLDIKKFENNLHQFNLLEVVERIGSIFYPQADKKGIGFYTYVDPSIPSSLYGDSTKLSQIYCNLSSNAIKFTKEGTVILSSFLESTNHETKSCKIRIECKDTGIGMSQDHLKIIFKPFEQINNEYSIEHKGYGLGLSIIDDLVKHLKGNIEVESKEGVGSKFTVNIPLECKCCVPIQDKLKPINNENFVVIHRSEEESLILGKYLKSMGAKNIVYEQIFSNEKDYILIVDQTMIDSIKDYSKYAKIIFIGEVIGNINKSLNSIELNDPIQLTKLNDALSKIDSPNIHLIPDSNNQTLKNMRILIVEDNKIIHKMERNLLQSKGIEFIQSAFNGQEALDLVEKYDFDCILMDIQMPILNGIDATKLIRQNPNPIKRQCKIVIITGNSLYDYKTSIINGADEVLSKPINTESLIKLLLKYSIK